MNWVEERLDRVVPTQSRKLMFDRVWVRNLIAPASDHRALFLEIASWEVAKKLRELGVRRVREFNCKQWGKGCLGVVDKAGARTFSYQCPKG
ncbi:hypothetical protein Syun_001434 [Stephania yunnanensis]|uniref:Uncharacterized protein n=1 Tax=Stephania yunnanensis TaxID=152371 RepID=A0AAP0LJE6_9MAGN